MFQLGSPLTTLGLEGEVLLDFVEDLIEHRRVCTVGYCVMCETYQTILALDHRFDKRPKPKYNKLAKAA